MYQKVKSRWGKHLDFILLDTLFLQIAFILAYYSRHGFGQLPYSTPLYQRMAIYLVLVEVCVIFFGENYSGILKRGYLQELKAVIKFVTAIVVATVVLLFLMQTSEAFSRSVFIQLWAIGIVLILIERMLAKKILSRHKRRGERRKVIIVTISKMADETVATVRENRFNQFSVPGIILIDTDQTGQIYNGKPVLASRDTMLDYIRQNVVDEVFFNVPYSIKIPEDILQGLIDMGVTIHRKLFKQGDSLKNQSVETFAGYTVLTTSIRIASTRQLFIKRLMDIAGGLVGSIIAIIAMIFVTPIIKKQSPGPVFFSQTRVGKNGRKFKIYKFRSMYMDAEERKKELMAQNKMSGLMFKMDNDPRIFPFGHFMRKTSIDELPQFFNVLKGDMSLVGTRPPTVDEYEQYELHHKRRLAAKPGLTGMWQASGRSDITDFEEVVKLDSYYIENWTLGLDIKIILKTIQVVLTRKGSV